MQCIQLVTTISLKSPKAFVEHRRYLDALLDAIGVIAPVTLIVHDWGSAWTSTGRTVIVMQTKASPMPGAVNFAGVPMQIG